MASKLYVGNLGAGTTDEQLKAMFERFGPVTSARVVMDATTGKPKGFGFVEMSDTKEADAAIKGLSGMEHDGRSLVVNRPGPRRSGDRPDVAKDPR
jgi:RNA recognition motif-containing protein